MWTQRYIRAFGQLELGRACEGKAPQGLASWLVGLVIAATAAHPPAAPRRDALELVQQILVDRRPGFGHQTALLAANAPLARPGHAVALPQAILQAR